MRLAAASVLVELYGEEGHVSMLSKFTMRFAGRYAELVYDLSEAVSVTGVSVFPTFAASGQCVAQTSFRQVLMTWSVTTQMASSNTSSHL